ncbi:hypothetical protein LIER_21915 [Lithospermum erythrorhizon]|uniref:Uncharacterized protein n=1 Tax=Lithospermum erythrorhizon TaxID=34254 RepID=A0AAV3QV16_LITER
MNSLPVPFTDTELWEIKEYFLIPDDVGIKVPVEGESIMAPIVKENDVGGSFCLGWTPVFLVAFSFSTRLPFSAKGDGGVSKNFLASPHPNKVHKNRFNGQWFFIRGGMGPRVPIWWTTLREACTLFVRDSAFIKSNIQGLCQVTPEKPSWKAYCEEGALIMAAAVWKSVQSVADPFKVEVAAMKGKRLPRFSSHLLIRKPLPTGATHIPIISSKRGSTSEPSATTSKRAKIEALNAATSTSSNPQRPQTIIIDLDDELTTSAQEAVGSRKEKSKSPSTVRSSEAILPFLAKSSTSSKKSKGKKTLLLSKAPHWIVIQRNI